MTKFVQTEWLITGLFGMLSLCITGVGFFLSAKLGDLDESIRGLTQSVVQVQRDATKQSVSFQFLLESHKELQVRVTSMEQKCRRIHN